MSPMHTGPRTRTRSIVPRPWRYTAPAAVAAVAAAGGLTLVSLDSSASAVDTLISQGKPATATSLESKDYTPASAAFDGNLTGTRWSSQASDNQAITVDLGSTYTVSTVRLVWEAAYASSYKIEESTDGTSWTTAYSTTTSTGGSQTVSAPGSARWVRMTGVKRATGYGYSLWEMQVFGSNGTAVTPTATPTVTPTATPAPAASDATNFPTNADPGEVITRPVPNPYPVPDSIGEPAHTAGDVSHHEFQANCSVTFRNPDDPIVYPGQPGASHDHSFMGSNTTDAYTTTSKLTAGGTSCGDANGLINSHDRSGYWFPTVFNGSTPVIPEGVQTIYYKSGVTNYGAVKPFPAGLRYVTGNSTAASAAEFQNSRGTVEGWECGNSAQNFDIPARCDQGAHLVIRYQAPSCWDGIHLDSPNHKSHMAYPDKIGDLSRCPADHPVAVPMLEFKMGFPVSGDMSQVRLSSGRGYTWHYDFFNGWDFPQLNALVSHCINGGLQCNPHGADAYKPGRGSALDDKYNVVIPGKYNPS